jgi:hypothetical protein
MKKILLLGDSYTGCFRHTWDFSDLKKEFKGIEIDVVARSQAYGGLNNLYIDGQSLMGPPKQSIHWPSPTHTRLKLTEYIAFIIIGSEIPLGLPKHPFLTSQLINAYCLDCLGKGSTVYSSLIRKIRSISCEAIYLCHAPLKVGNRGISHQIYYDSISQFNKMIAEKEQNISIAPQPISTLSDTANTLAHFIKEDGSHATDEFGEVFLTMLLGSITGKERGQATSPLYKFFSFLL